MSMKMVLLTGALVTAGVVVDAGFVHVKVHEQKPDGANINLWVPAILGTAGAHAIPEHKLREVAHKVQGVMPALRVAAEELQKVPDGPLVEVESAKERVYIAKRGNYLDIQVHDGKDDVELSVPLSMIEDIGRTLESKTAKP